MRIISTDGIGVAALVRAAEKIAEVVEEYGCALGVIDDPVLGKAVAVGYAKGRTILVTVEQNPKVVEIDG